jgi:hypothetical protein
MTKAADQAKAFLLICNSNGFQLTRVTDSVVTIMKTFTPDDKDAFATADMMSGTVLDYAPLKGGSVWGTDGGSIGGAVGLQRGQYVLNKSGEGKRFTSALKKLTGL